MLIHVSLDLPKTPKIYPRYVFTIKEKRLQAFTKTYHILTRFFLQKPS